MSHICTHCHASFAHRSGKSRHMPTCLNNPKGKHTSSDGNEKMQIKDKVIHSSEKIENKGEAIDKQTTEELSYVVEVDSKHMKETDETKEKLLNEHKEKLIDTY